MFWALEKRQERQARRRAELQAEIIRELRQQLVNQGETAAVNAVDNYAHKIGVANDNRSL